MHSSRRLEGTGSSHGYQHLYYRVLCLGLIACSEALCSPKRILVFRTGPLRRMAKGTRAPLSPGSETTPTRNVLINALREHPTKAAMLIGAVRATVADAIVQLSEGGPFDIGRLVAFSAFGFFVIGVVLTLFYVHTLPRLFLRATRFSTLSWQDKLRDRSGQREVAAQLALDQFVFQPIVYFHCYYAISELVRGSGSLVNAHAIWKENVFVDATRGACFWVPFQIMSYAFLPVYLRMPAMNVAGFIWLILLSSLRGCATSS